jgi:WD40 repeat protein
VRFVIKVPAKPTTSLSARRPAYVSPATQSITVAITGSATQTLNANLTPTSTGCSSTLASTVCTLSISLDPGTYTAAVTTYDGANETGSVLSAGQDVDFTVTQGQSNAILLTLNGVPTAIQVNTQSSSVTGTMGTGFTLTGLTMGGMLQAVALDADGDVIVGAGAPTFTLAQSSGTSFTIVQPTTTAPNSFTLTAPSSGAAGVFTITAAYPDSTCSTSGAVCTATFSATGHGQYVVASVGSSYEVWAPPYTGAPVTLSGVTGSLQLIDSAAFDAAGNLYVIDSQYNGGAGQILEYAPPYTGSPTSIGAGTLSDPTAILIGPDGKMFVSSFDNSSVFVWTPPYTGAPLTLTTDVSDPSSLALDSNEDLFVSNFSGSAADEFAVPYTGAPTLLNGTNMTASIHVAPTGEAFLLDIGLSGMLEFVPPYTGTPTTLTNGVNNPLDVVFRGDGTMFVSQPSGVTLFAPPYTTPGAAIAVPAGGPVAMALDDASDLFVANYSSDTITAYTPPYTGAAARTLTAGGTVYDVDVSR